MGCTVHDTSCKEELFPFDSTEIEQQQNKSVFLHISEWRNNRCWLQLEYKMILTLSDYILQLILPTKITSVGHKTPHAYWTY